MQTDHISTHTLQWSTDRIRTAFLDFFAQKGHAEYASSPVVPADDDDTLLFANAGMNQFKAILTGKATARDARVCSAQKCIRAGGKHNDLDAVGRDSYHHTFFEMLGSWSFNDYPLVQAIAWAWEFLTDKMGLSTDRLYATYNRNDPETRILWSRWLPDDRIIACGDEDNFWEMGGVGNSPCGPCTEIHYDRRGNRQAANLVNTEDSEVIELWNLVLVDRERLPDGSLRSLSQRHIDTGMGLERLAAVVNNVDNYMTDGFRDVIIAIEALCPAQTYTGRYDNITDAAYRLVADHLRSIVVAMSDGACPGNSGRDYVVRRLIRRAMRAWTAILKAPGSLAQLVPAVVKTMSYVYPEISMRQSTCMMMINREENGFAKNLARGNRMFRKMVSAGHMSGEDVFKLWDAYGFPTDLTQDLAREHNITLDMMGFEACMQAQRRRSHASRQPKSSEACPDS